MEDGCIQKTEAGDGDITGHLRESGRRATLTEINFGLEGEIGFAGIDLGADF